jgi:hypothetical protein
MTMGEALRTTLAALTIGLVIVPAARGGETRTAAPNAVSPAAQLTDLEWLVGEWVGEGLGGQAIEAWSSPAGGQMAGHFRQARADGSIWFYELMTVAQTGASLELRLKHFNADLTGWEDKAHVVSFRLIGVESEAWYFDGLTIRRDGPERMIVAVRIANQDSTERETVFRYRRVRR